MRNGSLPELWEWAEYYCPWCYVAAVRLHRVAPEFHDQVRLRIRAFPLEVFGGGPPNRKELELEIWLAALQEPEAVFKPFKAEWPTTTLPAFEAAWCAFEQDEAIGRDFDLRIRQAFFAEGRDIGSREVMWELAQETDLDLGRFRKAFSSGEARAAILEEGRIGQELYKVRSTPTVMLSNGRKLRHPLAYPNIQDDATFLWESCPAAGKAVTTQLVCCSRRR